MPAIVRMEKEVRALFWPWLAVVSLASLHLFWDLHGYTLFGFFIGVPVIAALSFGHEFHHGTMDQLLSLPAPRARIWTEKSLVMVVFVALATAAFWYVWKSALTPIQLQTAGLYLLAMTASAAYWTLQARSTFGGVTLAWMPFWVLWVAALLHYYFFPESIVAPFFRGGELTPEEATRILSLVSPLALGYAGLLLWLGIRKLERFQVTGEGTNKDVLANLPLVLPEALRARFRPQAGEPLLNLLRKELRLLRPIWALALLFVIYEACLFALGIGFPEDGPGSQRSPILDVAFIVPIVSIVPMAIVLAGCLPLGEERKWGTHSWHLTLPVSPQRQWLTKLLTGIFTALVCGVLLPILAVAVAKYRSGSQPESLEWSAAVQWALLVCCATVVSFWCACVGHGTVRGAMWVFPVFGVIQLAEKYGFEAGEKIVSGTGSFRDFLVSRYQLDPFAARGIQFFFGPELWIWLSLPVVVLALYQSRKLFRTQPQEGMLWMVRRLLPLALMALATGFAATAVGSAHWYPYPEILKALDALGVADAQRQFGVSDLDSAAPLSRNTQRWLQDSRIAVVPNSQTQTYEVTFGLASGRDCKMVVKRFQGRSLLWQVHGCKQRGS